MNFDPPEPPEPEEPRSDAADGPAVLKFEIHNYQLEQMLSQSLENAVNRQVHNSIATLAEKAVKRAVDAAVKELTDEVIRGHVEKALAEGWNKVNSWGEPQGDKVTLSSVVRAGLLAMTEKPSGYNNANAKSPMQAIVEELAAQGVKQGLEPLLKEAKEQLKSQLDLSIGKALRLTVGELAK